MKNKKKFLLRLVIGGVCSAPLAVMPNFIVYIVAAFGVGWIVFDLTQEL